MASGWDGGKPSGIVSNLKDGRHSMALEPLELIEKAVVVKLGVDEGYMKAFVVKQFGQFQHWLHMALCRKWNADYMRASH